MPSLDSLPGDQRAVLQLVLGRGRSYDEIARLLTIDSAKVRERAHAALNALGPDTHVAPELKGLIADYLLGQLSDQDAEDARDVLADSPSERAWARVVSGELAPLARDAMPEIPVERSAGRAHADAPPEEASAPVRAPEHPSVREPETGAGVSAADAEATPRRQRRGRRDGEPKPIAAPRSSRRGGALVILLGVIAVAVVLFIVLGSGGSKKPKVASTPAATASTPAAGASTTATTSGSSTSAKVVSQINLTPPAGKSASKAAGIAEILNEGSADGVAIVAQNIPANTTKPPNAYAVWLYNSPSDAHILGFVNPGVGKTGRLSTAGGLPTNAKRFKQLVVTVETTASPKAPGTIILQGALTGL
jgi:hypothetical protein